MNRTMVFCIMALVCLAIPAASALQQASVITIFHISDGKVTPVSSRIVYGGSPNYPLDSGEFIVTSSDAGGAYEKQAWIEDPRVRRILQFDEGEPSAVVRDDVDFEVILPFRGNTAKVSVYDKNRVLLAETDLSGARTAFCMAHPVDERCRGTAILWGVVLLVVVVIAGAGGYILIRKKKGAA